jgi:hypothetical protein
MYGTVHLKICQLFSWLGLKGMDQDPDSERPEKKDPDPD